METPFSRKSENLNKEAGNSSETLKPLNETTRCNNVEHRIYFYQRYDFKFYANFCPSVTLNTEAVGSTETTHRHVPEGLNSHTDPNDGTKS
jgi:hypothetical protein